METPSDTPQQGTRSPRALIEPDDLAAVHLVEPVPYADGGSNYTPPLCGYAPTPQGPWSPRTTLDPARVTCRICATITPRQGPQADPAGEHTIAARSLPPIAPEDWAAQAWINLKLLLDGLPLTPDSATLQAFLEQAPDRVTIPAKVALGLTERSDCNEPHLGLATTAQLLDEIRARFETGAVGLGYRTVDPT